MAACRCVGIGDGGGGLVCCVLTALSPRRRNHGCRERHGSARGNRQGGEPVAGSSHRNRNRWSAALDSSRQGGMNLSVGIIGLENSGKTALFQALTRGIRSSGRSGMATISVPDDRLRVLAEMVHPKRIVPAGVQIVDVGGVGRGAGESGGLGAQFLSALQGIEALAIVLRFYSRPDIGFGPEAASPVEDLESILLELSLSDLGQSRNGWSGP